MLLLVPSTIASRHADISVLSSFVLLRGSTFAMFSSFNPTALIFLLALGNNDNRERMRFNR